MKCFQRTGPKNSEAYATPMMSALGSDVQLRITGPQLKIGSTATDGRNPDSTEPNMESNF